MFIVRRSMIFTVCECYTFKKVDRGQNSVGSANRDEIDGRLSAVVFDETLTEYSCEKEYPDHEDDFHRTARRGVVKSSIEPRLSTSLETALRCGCRLNIYRIVR